MILVIVEIQYDDIGTFHGQLQGPEAGRRDFKARIIMTHST